MHKLRVVRAHMLPLRCCLKGKVLLSTPHIGWMKSSNLSHIGVMSHDLLRESNYILLQCEAHV